MTMLLIIIGLYSDSYGILGYILFKGIILDLKWIELLGSFQYSCVHIFANIFMRL